MSRSVEETRRDFLVRLARTVAFVAPAMVSLDASPLAAQGGGGTGGKGKATTTSTVGSLTPTSSGALMAPTQEQQLQTDETLPWAPGSSEPAPWTVPPPTSTG